ncbi:hypothetical protein CcaverHIS002_0204370 [Cutaneotrichosporon cavernicola]|nr:hypothetical protein CcaverHIS002_0204370 [Cutaneotrichosporon cavernicola]
MFPQRMPVGRPSADAPVSVVGSEFSDLYNRHLSTEGLPPPPGLGALAAYPISPLASLASLVSRPLPPLPDAPLPPIQNDRQATTCTNEPSLQSTPFSATTTDRNVPSAHGLSPPRRLPIPLPTLPPLIPTPPPPSPIRVYHYPAVAGWSAHHLPLAHSPFEDPILWKEERKGIFDAMWGVCVAALAYLLALIRRQEGGSASIHTEALPSHGTSAELIRRNVEF